MRFKLLILFFVFLPLCIWAQDIPFRVKSSTKYSSSTMLGVVEEDSVRYNQFRLIQEIKLKKFGIGLDLDFLFDENYHLKKDDWNKFSVIPDKFYYLRYADPGDLIFLHFGGFPKLSKENGLVMLNYSNMSLYPNYRQNGLMIGTSLNTRHKLELTLFSSNLQKNDILSFDLHFNPVPDSTLFLLDKTRIGLNFYTDRNQYANLKYLLPDSLYTLIAPQKRSEVSFIGGDISQPIMKNKYGELGIYSEIAHIVNNGTGYILPGVYLDLSYLKVNLEYRIHGEKFVPTYFDRFYEKERAQLLYDEEGEPYIQTKLESIQEDKASMGFYGKVQAMISKRLKTSFAWQNMYGEELSKGKSMWFDLKVDTQYKRLENIAVAYDKLGVERLSITSFAEPRAIFKAETTLRADRKGKLFLIARYSERYPENGKTKNRWLKAKRSVAAGVKVLL